MPCVPDRVIFLDRDGVINRRRPDHVRSWRQLEFLPHSLDALRALHELEERVVVVTNQSVVGRGLITAAELTVIHERMVEVVARNGGHIEHIYVCTHAPRDGCGCRKPGVGLLLRAATELSIDLEQSILVGDSLSDIQAAQAAGCRPIVVGEHHPAEIDHRIPLVAGLREAVVLIASDRRGVLAGC
jgi:D-glycero-D-manno-heptose 1,7-bisphosphate phosphatase